MNLFFDVSLEIYNIDYITITTYPKYHHIASDDMCLVNKPITALNDVTVQRLFKYQRKAWLSNIRTRIKENKNVGHFYVSQHIP